MTHVVSPHDDHADTSVIRPVLMLLSALVLLGAALIAISFAAAHFFA